MKPTDHALHMYNSQRSTTKRKLPCWAPYTSLYIGFRGKVSSCCYNKTYVLGEYPQQSLSEIWQSHTLLQLKDALTAHNFSLGCHGCKELIDAENYNALPAKNFDRLIEFKGAYPVKVDFELSNECNLECVMCRGEFSSAIRKNREKLPPIHSVYNEEFVDQLEEFIPFIRESHFLGGEPFLVPIYVEIWERMIALNPQIRISIQTNATVMTPRVRSILQRMKFDIAVSIDSLDEATYALIRKNGELNAALKNIRFFHDYCREKQSNFSLSFCPMVQNYMELADIAAFANELHCEVFFNTVYHPVECAISALPSTQIQEIIERTRPLVESLPETDTIAKHNKQSAQQVLLQFKLWAKEAAENEAILHISGHANFEAYMDGFKTYLTSTGNHTSTAVDELVVNVRQKLEFLLDAAARHGRRNQAEAHILTISYTQILQSVPSVDREHLLHLFKSFIMPLPDEPIS